MGEQWSIKYARRPTTSPIHEAWENVLGPVNFDENSFPVASFKKRTTVYEGVSREHAISVVLIILRNGYAGVGK
jgi:hypothetical protein